MRRNKSNHKGEMFDPFTSNNGSKLPEDGSGCNVCVYLFYFWTWLTEYTGIWIGQGRVVCGIREFDSSNERVGRCLKMAKLLVHWHSYDKYIAITGAGRTSSRFMVHLSEMSMSFGT